MSDGFWMDPVDVAAVGQRLGSTGEVLRRAASTTGRTRFGPDAVGPDLRAHGAAYAAGMRDVGVLVEAMAASVAHLVDQLDSAAAVLVSRDSDIAADLRSAAGPT